MSDKPGQEYLYRYEDVAYASYIADEFGSARGSHIEVELRKFRIKRRTEKGVWIDLSTWCLYDDDERFVLNDGRKRFACPTVEEAMESFFARKKAQIRILGEQLRRARLAILAMERHTLSSPIATPVVPDAGPGDDVG